MTDYQCENCDYNVPEGHLVAAEGNQWKCPKCGTWTKTIRRDACSPSALNGVLFTLVEEMERQSSGILDIAKCKAADDAEGSRSLMTIGGVVGMLAECLKATLEKSK